MVPREGVVRCAARLAFFVGLLPLAAGSIAAAPASAARQGSGEEAAESELDRLFRLAREGSAAVRPQAAQRLAEFGATAAERLLLEFGPGTAEMAGTGPELVEVAGRFADARLRAKLWEALADPDFPWRPQATRGLAGAPAAGESARFLALLSDRLAAVREAALGGARALSLASEKERVRPLLADPDDRVRRAAASLLIAWGEPCAIAWLIEDLKREDRFFERDTGKLARYQALRMLEGELAGGAERSFGFQPERAWDDPVNADARAALLEFAQELCGGALPELPPVARAGRATEGDVLGLEIRSCRKGEFQLRWSVADVLYVGSGNAVAIALPAGTVQHLRELAAAELPSLGRTRLYGEPGCDLEQFLWRTEPGARTTSFHVSKGHAPVSDLRPPPLGRLARALLATLPEDGPDPRTANLRADVTAALTSVGGSVPLD